MLLFEFLARGLQSRIVGGHGRVRLRMTVVVLVGGAVGGVMQIRPGLGKSLGILVRPDRLGRQRRQQEWTEKHNRQANEQRGDGPNGCTHGV